MDDAIEGSTHTSLDSAMPDEGIAVMPLHASGSSRGRVRRVLSWFTRGDGLSWQHGGWVLSGLIVLGFILRVRAWHLFNGAFPIEGDLVSQNWWLVEFRERLGSLLTGGHLFGWTDDFGAGQPFGYFYFPLPATIFSVLSIGVGDAVAVKLLQFGAFAMVPYGLWRGLGLVGVGRTSRILAVGVVAAGSFFPHRYPIGADLWSVLIGEYSYAWGAGFGLWFLGAVYAVACGRTGWRSVAFLGAATALSHANVAFAIAPAAIVATLVGVGVSLRIRRRIAVVPIAAVGVSIVGLCAFWLLPMQAMYANVQGNNKIGDAPLSFWFTNTIWATVAVIGLAGLFTGILRLRASAWCFSILGGSVAVLHEILTEHPEFELWAGRVIPFLYIALLGGVAELFAAFIAWAPRRMCAWMAVTVVAIGAGGVAWSQHELHTMFGGELADRGAAVWRGIGHGDPVAAARVDELVLTLGRLEPGRVFYAGVTDSYLTYGAMDLNGEIQRRLGGPGGASTFFHEANRGRYALSFAHTGLASEPATIEPGGRRLGLDDFDVAVEMLRQFGVRYYIVGDTTLSVLAGSDSRLTRVAVVGDINAGTNNYFEVYELADHGVVEAVRREPGISQTLPLWGETTWTGKVREWMQRLDAEVFEGVYLVENAPVSIDWTGRATYDPVQITNVEVSDESVAFSVDRVGVPVVVRMGYSEEWHVNGAEGPFHVAPDGMIVIPSQRDVSLRFVHPPAERQGLVISFATLVLIGVSWRRQRRHAAEAQRES